MGGYAWVTLATNDSYSLGALVLAHSLKQVGTQQQLAVLITPGVTSAMRIKLHEVFNVVQEVNLLDSKDETNLRLLKRPELGITFTKLHCWRLTQFDKCVFLDADTLVLENCDELFDREELSAAPDIGWPDCFNSGVFVYRPSNDTYEKLVQFALEKGSFDGGDQGLLNLYFSDWAHKDISKHLPFIYNMASTACYSYLPAFKQFGGNAKIIHFIGSSKPWLQYFETEKREVHPSQDLQHLKGLLQHWWNIFCTLIHSNLSPEMAGIAGAFAKLTLGAPRTAEQLALDDHLRRQGWEVGNIDYLGRDSFDNIWNKICATLSTAPESTTEPTPPPSEEKPIEQPSAPTAEVQTLPAPEKEPSAAPELIAPELPKAETPVSETIAPISESPKPEEIVKPVPQSPSEPPKTETTTTSDALKPTVEPPTPTVESPKPTAEPPKPIAEPPKPIAEPPKPIAEPPKPEPEPPVTTPLPELPKCDLPQEVPKPELESPKDDIQTQKIEPELPKPETPKSEPDLPKAEPQIPKSVAEPEAEISKQPDTPVETKQDVPVVKPEASAPESVESAPQSDVPQTVAETAKPAEPSPQTPDKSESSQEPPVLASPKPSEEPKTAESPKTESIESVESQTESTVTESKKSASVPEVPQAVAAPSSDAETPKESAPKEPAKTKASGEDKKTASSKESKKSKEVTKAESTDTAPPTSPTTPQPKPAKSAEVAAPEAPAATTQESTSGPTPPPRKASGEKKKTATKTKK